MRSKREIGIGRVAAQTDRSSRKQRNLLASMERIVVGWTIFKINQCLFGHTYSRKNRRTGLKATFRQ